MELLFDALDDLSDNEQIEVIQDLIDSLKDRNQILRTIDRLQERLESTCSNLGKCPQCQSELEKYRWEEEQGFYGNDMAYEEMTGMSCPSCGWSD